MKAAIVTSLGMKPSYGEFHSPVWREGLEVITVTAAALTNLTKGRAAGSHIQVADFATDSAAKGKNRTGK
jgi:hypothetical protein